MRLMLSVLRRKKFSDSPQNGWSQGHITRHVLSSFMQHFHQIWNIAFLFLSMQKKIFWTVLKMGKVRTTWPLTGHVDRYANRAKNIKNKPKINEDPKDALLREFQEEIARLKAALEQKGGGVGGGRKRHSRKEPRTGPNGLLSLKLFA